MTPVAFKRSLPSAVLPKALAPELQALWWARKGDWDKAHRIVMDEHSKAAAWVRAYLHRVEGDVANAGYCYRQASANTPPARSSTNGPTSSRHCFSGTRTPAERCGFLAVNHQNGQFSG